MNSYLEILEKTQQYIAKEHSELLTDEANYTHEERESILKSNIGNYIKGEGFKCEEFSEVSTLSLEIFNSMVKFDCLTNHLLDDEFIRRTGLEEININSWDAIWITDSSGTYLYDRWFPSRQKAIDFINNIGTKLDKTANDGTPIFLGEIRKNIRIACAVNPVTDDEAGVSASIRIVRLDNFSKDELISFETATEPMLDMLTSFLSAGVNICFAGSTGSGKTGSLNYLLSETLNKTRKRLITLEIESREFDLQKYNEKGRPIYNIVNWTTRESFDEKYNINCNTLSNLSMRFNGSIIAIGEMRNEEALLACDIASTGHTVITTTHSMNAVTAYDRIVDLCKKASPYSDDKTLYNKALKAFPIVCFQEQMLDGSRKITEIIEGLDYKDGEVIYNTIYSYDIENVSKQKVNGSFKKNSEITSKTRSILLKSFSKEYVETL